MYEKKGETYSILLFVLNCHWKLNLTGYIPCAYLQAFLAEMEAPAVTAVQW